jgi:Ca2+-binding RTX toxin-like protein
MAVIDGTSGDDQLVSIVGEADTISGLGGNDQVVVNDTLYGDAGDDSLEGGDGDDVLNGGTGANALEGRDGNDTFYLTSDVSSGSGIFSFTWAHGGNGDDTFYFGAVTNESLAGGDGNDQLLATADGARLNPGRYGEVELVSGEGFDDVRLVGSEFD